MNTPQGSERPRIELKVSKLGKWKDSWEGSWNQSSVELGEGGVWCGFEGGDSYPGASMLLINPLKTFAWMAVAKQLNSCG